MTRIKNFLIKVLGGYTLKELSEQAPISIKNAYEEYEIITVSTKKSARTVNTWPVDIVVRNSIMEMIGELKNYVEVVADEKDQSYTIKLRVLENTRSYLMRGGK